MNVWRLTFRAFLLSGVCESNLMDTQYTKTIRSHQTTTKIRHHKTVIQLPQAQNRI